MSWNACIGFRLRTSTRPINQSRHQAHPCHQEAVLASPASSMSQISEEFAQFVARQQPAVEDPPVDWGKVREEYLKAVELLYQNVHHVLAPFHGQPGQPDPITSNFERITITEDFLGSYSALQMIVRIGKSAFLLKPVGTQFIGCNGRVDITGSMGLARLELHDGAWKVRARSPERSLVDLTQESFLSVLLEVANA
jgi:hypothetical protein